MMSEIISIDNLQEGMVLAEPVINNFGQTLLNTGVCINAHHKKILKTWNIHNLHIQSESSDNNSSVEFGQDILNFIESALSSRMKWKPDLKIENDLFKTAVIVNAQQLRNTNELD